VAQVLIYMTEVADMPVIDRVYREFFEPPYPNRSSMGVNALVVSGMKIEIVAYARRAGRASGLGARVGAAVGCSAPSGRPRGCCTERAMAPNCPRSAVAAGRDLPAGWADGLTLGARLPAAAASVVAMRSVSNFALGSVADRHALQASARATPATNPSARCARHCSPMSIGDLTELEVMLTMRPSARGPCRRWWP
jgi:hypothetical protein